MWDQNPSTVCVWTDESTGFMKFCSWRLEHLIVTAGHTSVGRPSVTDDPGPWQNPRSYNWKQCVPIPSFYHCKTASTTTSFYGSKNPHSIFCSPSIIFPSEEQRLVDLNFFWYICLFAFHPVGLSMISFSHTSRMKDIQLTIVCSDTPNSSFILRWIISMLHQNINVSNLLIGKRLLSKKEPFLTVAVDLQESEGQFHTYPSEVFDRLCRTLRLLQLWHTLVFCIRPKEAAASDQFQ